MVPLSTRRWQECTQWGRACLSCHSTMRGHVMTIRVDKANGGIASTLTASSSRKDLRGGANTEIQVGRRMLKNIGFIRTRKNGSTRRVCEAHGLALTGFYTVAYRWPVRSCA